MGTRHLTVVLNENKEELVNIYGQYDGHLSSQGDILKQFLTDFVMVDGFTGEDEKRPKCANGMGCLAGQLVGHVKKRGVGGVYLEPPNSRGHGEEYIYTIYFKDKLCMKIQSGCMTFFGLPGTPPEDMNVLYDGPVEEFDPEKDYQ